MRFAASLAVGAPLIALAVAVLPAGRGALAQPVTTTVQVGDFYFCSPSFQNGICETTVNAGDTIEWQFAGNALHSTTGCAENFDNCQQPHVWDSPFLVSGSFSFTFDTPGTYLYRCQVHPNEMRGSVTVLAQATPTPSATATPSPAAGTANATATPSPAADTATATAAPAGGRPVAVPSGGGAPPGSQASELEWLGAVAGALLAAAAVAAMLRARGH